MVINSKRQAKKVEMRRLGLTGKSYRRLLKKQRRASTQKNGG